MERVSAWTELVTPSGNYRYGSLVGGKAPTPIKAEWLNMVQGELVNFILAYLPVLDASDNTQLLQAARAMINNLAQKATTLGGYGILDAYTKNETDYLLSRKADWAITLAGYGIGDAYTAVQTDALLLGKANKATTLGGYGILDAYTKNETDYLLSRKADWAITLAGYGITNAYTKSEVYAKAEVYGKTETYSQYEVNEALVLKQNRNTGLMAANGWSRDSATGKFEVWGTISLDVPAGIGSKISAEIVFAAQFPNAVFNISYSKVGGNLTEALENSGGFGAPSKTGVTVTAQRMSGAQDGGEATVIHYRVTGN